MKEQKTGGSEDQIWTTNFDFQLSSSSFFFLSNVTNFFRLSKKVAVLRNTEFVNQKVFFFACFSCKKYEILIVSTTQTVWSFVFYSFHTALRELV